MTNIADGGLFEEIATLPDSIAKRRYDELVGLDDVKTRLDKEASLLIDPTQLESWSKEHHGGRVIAATRAFGERIPLFIFAGDVGTGKTALAETFGDRVARELDVELFLMRLSLRARGAGSVGEMTQLISSAFDYVQKEIPVPKVGKRPRSAAVVLIDEADALAQSRELAQMHHEDRAGVNALIRGIDGIAQQHRPVITVMCSNRLSALDPAIQRRAADIFEFRRPTQTQREKILRRAFGDAGITDEQVEELARLTGENNHRDYGYTYSDLTTRLIPNAVLDALPSRPLAFERVAELAAQTPPTAPFAQTSGEA
jgi:AAA+ superfamily predicted ATPase